MAKGVMAKARTLVKKADKKAVQAVKSIKKEWEKEQPKREKYGRELKEAANKALKNGAKIGSDIVAVIKKDIKEINNK